MLQACQRQFPQGVAGREEALMSFEEHSDCFLWRCDGKDCEKEVLFKPHDFMGCVAELRSRGWSFHLDEDTGREGSGRQWSHYCGRCRKSLAEVLRMPLKQQR
jgi:hypothetical protein